jgi:ABC-type multidrug transport system ATPase subunit
LHLILLLDEVETALHPEALSGVFRFLVEMCRAARVQLFVSTHSLEAVDAMLASVGDDVSDLVAYHLPPRDSHQTVYRLGGQSIRSMRSEGGVDLR